MNSFKSSETIWIFGGSFDPPHKGHQIAAQGALENPGAKEIWMMPSASPPLKTAPTPEYHRYEMSRLAFENLDSRIKVSDFEIKRQDQNPSYTLKTLKALKPQIPHLGFMMGSDQLLQFEKWHGFPELFDLCHWCILLRKNDEEKGLIPHLYERLSKWVQQGFLSKKGPHSYSSRSGKQFILVPTPAQALSSTSVRETIEITGHVPVEEIPSEVQRYLKSHQLYGTKEIL
ncbi:MAG: nicotinate (nicotinamide) nucleotide adenylyltransferase [Bdellovibrionaceae bacterium]|nr:nicotinate (nicotinamide) nucleotide adenylyltransferase [Pseudobdellovibrionaceae bacterium]|tara:strand:- start:120 stop:809 length:690 start_codon:yes stop_codon:yes gene_type:complete